MASQDIANNPPALLMSGEAVGLLDAGTQMQANGAAEAAEPLSVEPVCFATDDPELIHRARQMTAAHYLKRGYVTQEEITDDGVISPEADPYVDHSTYYVLMQPGTDEIIATSRKIHFDPDKGEKSFPLFDHKDELDPGYIKQLDEIGLENTVEISALIKNPDLDRDGLATLYLYRKLFQDAWSTDTKQKEEAFIMACSPTLYEKFTLFFNGSMHKMGPDLDYPGQKAIPTVFFTRDGSVELIDKAAEPGNENADVHKMVVDLMLKGADPNTLDASLMKALKRNGLSDTLDNLLDQKENATLLEKLKGRKPELLFGLGLLAYTAGRTIVVGETISPHSAVDWRVFLGLEVATTPQYVYGMGDLARSALNPDRYSRSQRIRAAMFAGSALLAPYAYIGAESHDMPAQSWEGFGAIATVGLFSVLAKVRNNFRNRRQDEAKEQDATDTVS